MRLTEEERTILEAIKRGSKENPVLRYKLEDEIDDDGIKVRKIIGDLRMMGHRICSFHNGYYIARDEEQYEKYKKKILRKIAHLHKMLEAMDTVVNE